MNTALVELEVIKVHYRYFNRHGWPTSTILPNAPTNEDEQSKLIDTIQVLHHRVVPLPVELFHVLW